MALLHLRFHSNVLEKQTSLHVIVPETGKGPFPVYYLLHGLSDDDSAWCRRSSIERYAADWPLIIVMPDGACGWYTDAWRGSRYESHVAQEVPERIERWLPARRGDNQARVVGGLSMGGYGAMKLALKYPGRYSAVAAHSGAFYFGRGGEPPEERHRLAFELINGPNPRPDVDVFALAKANRKCLPPIRFDCGTEDHNLAVNREFHAHLKTLGVPHDFQSPSGRHDWRYWSARVQKALPFLGQALAIESVAATDG